MEANKISWIFPFVGGILIIIGMFLPASIPIKNTETIWLLGFSVNGQISLLNNNLSLIISIICSIVLTICALKLIKTSFEIRKDEDDNIFAEKVWLIIGLVILVVIVFWMFSIHYLITFTKTVKETEDSLTTTTTTTYRFWEYNSIGPAIIFVIIGGVLSIIGACIKGFKFMKDQ